MLKRLLALASTLGMAAHLDFLGVSAIPAVNLELDTSSTPLPGSSKLGGAPDLSSAESWPSGGPGPYRFLCQFALDDLPRFDSSPLPKDGLLSFFHVDDPDGEVEPSQEGYVVALYVPGGVEVQPVDPPSGHASSPGPFSVGFRLSLDLPQDEYQSGGWPFATEAEAAAYERELRRSLRSAPDHLLGYPHHSTLAYDPSPGEGWIHLLTLSSLEALEWCWGDGDQLMIFIERERLAHADFSNLRCDAG